MVGSPFDIEVGVSENVTAALDAARRRGGDMTPAMGEIARFMVEETGERFRAETGPDGVPWKKSLRVTGYTDAQGQHIAGDGGQTLTLKGDLRRSIKPDWGADYAAAGPEASAGAAVYGRIHQLGGKITPRPQADGTPHILQKALSTPFGYRASVTIPARPYLGFTGVTATRTVEILGDHIGSPFAGSIEGGA